MKKRAYFIEYPDKGFATIIKDDGDSQEIWTAERPDSDAYIAKLTMEGYDVVAYCSAGYMDPKLGRARRKWYRIDTNSDGVDALLGTHATTALLKALTS